MGKISDSYSGKQKWFKGSGRIGNKKLDEYQKMLLDMEDKQLPTNNKELANKRYSYDTTMEKCKICKSHKHNTDEHWKVKNGKR